MVCSTTALIRLSVIGLIGGANYGPWMYFNIFLFLFLGLIDLGISYLMLKLKRKWRTIVAVWSLTLFFPIYFGLLYEFVEKKAFLFLEYGQMILQGEFGATLIGIQLAAAIVAWWLGYDWLRGQRRKLSENAVRTQEESGKLQPVRATFRSSVLGGTQLLAQARARRGLRKGMAI